MKTLLDWDESELPVTCMMATPVLSTRSWNRFAEEPYEWLVSSLQGRGVAVEGHPAACTTEGCHHPKVWHAHKTRDHACRIEGCACMKLQRAGTPGGS